VLSDEFVKRGTAVADDAAAAKRQGTPFPNGAIGEVWKRKWKDIQQLPFPSKTL